MTTDSFDPVRALDEQLAGVGLSRWTPVPVLQMSNAAHVSRVQPFWWRWHDIEAGLQQVRELSAPGARPLVRLVNPSTNAQWPSVTSTLGCNVTLLNPGERWHAHKHIAEAIRFTIRGNGGFVIDGEQCVMGPGDLAVTPSFVPHEHINESSEQTVWIDGLNVGIVRSLEVPFYEEFPGETLSVTRTSMQTAARYGAAGLKAPWLPPVNNDRPRLMHYRWDATYEALKQLAASGDASPFDDILLEYVEPGTDRSPLRTIGCFVQLIRPGISTLAHRQTSSGVFYCHRGRGVSIVGGTQIKWSTGDFFVVPPWTWHEHASSSDGESILFSMQDTPVYKSLGLYHEEAYPPGHQVPDDRTRKSTLNDVWNR
jgi:gentisate 1,2-dioxygenase